MPESDIDLPETLQRSPAKAQRTYAKALESALETYDGDEARAHRVAFAALKHSFRKVGDHWEPKERRGPSDPQAAKGGAEALAGTTPTAGGKEVGVTKAELLERARALDIPGRSKMDRDELVRAIAKAQD
ncbi:MAG: ChaB family protein [Acidimicrobiales bacterium]|jgi:cation transport regulator ChaB|nr:ChaB family protein [Acidimicrobiales bacterium]